MELVEPSAEYKDSFIEAVKEFQNDDDYTHRNQWYRKQSIPELEADFEGFVAREVSHARGENIPENYVPYSTFWLVDGGKFIGQTNVRHQLNDHLMQIGGHIGYDIRPSERGKGYGNEILALALQKAKELGIDRARLTCDIRNIPSRKVIEKNGGVFDSQIFNPEMGQDCMRYWIDLK